jgi:hypothetical protein
MSCPESEGADPFGFGNLPLAAMEVNLGLNWTLKG